MVVCYHQPMNKKHIKNKQTLIIIAFAVLLAYNAFLTFAVIGYAKSANDATWSVLMRMNDLEQRLYNVENR